MPAWIRTLIWLSGRDIQRDIDRPDFGMTYNSPGRQVRGVFEIVWNGNK